MASGTVEWFRDDTCFGFITPDDSSKELFVHHSGIAGKVYGSLAEGAKVSYDAVNGDKCTTAVDVRVI
jgi:CspA family cold shock protein